MMQPPPTLDKAAATLVASLRKRDPNLTAAELRDKVQDDVRFLEDRIARTRKQGQIHASEAHTYYSMLACRRRVLAWIDQQHPQIAARDAVG